ncbi:insulin-like growth factor-binding protein 1a [Hoplias malabaricus]|uniref:insulin-like growth factor-binding protein 1a n=1 Tax=Hoplias malabaricus TaxID=27720 RepID=UPI003462A0A8
MSGMWVQLLLCVAAAGTLVSASPVVVPEPLRCAPCSRERLDACPPVRADCAEALREPGCGCCLVCALSRGDACGIYTAPCGSGLRCVPRLGEPRPLHALTRGQAVCMDAEEYEQEQSQRTPDPELEADPSSPVFVSNHGKPLDARLVSGAQDSMKSKANTFRRKLVEQGPCHVELQRALEKIAKSQQKLEDKLTRFYLPNCDKHGLYKPKQCESSLDGQRGKCWCVSSWNGKKVLGSSELPVDADCPQEPNH